MLSLVPAGAQDPRLHQGRIARARGPGHEAIPKDRPSRAVGCARPSLAGSLGRGKPPRQLTAVAGLPRRPSRRVSGLSFDPTAFRVDDGFASCPRVGPSPLYPGRSYLGLNDAILSGLTESPVRRSWAGGGAATLAMPSSDARRTAPLLAETGPHRLEDLGQDGRGAIVVEIDHQWRLSGRWHNRARSVRRKGALRAHQSLACGARVR
jgi:hypothetical protein